MICQLTVYRVDLPHFPTRKRSLNPQHHPSLSAAALLVCRSLVRLRPCVEAALQHCKFYANITISGLTCVRMTWSNCAEVNPPSFRWPMVGFSPNLHSHMEPTCRFPCPWRRTPRSSCTAASTRTRPWTGWWSDPYPKRTRACRFRTPFRSST